MEDYGLLEILGSDARVKIVEALSARERTLGELAGIAGVTPQAILKHLAVLQKGGLVEGVEFRVGLVKKVYRLSAILDVMVEAKTGLRMIHILLGPRKVEGKRTEISPDNLQNHLMILEEEKRILRRKLRSIREKEARLFEEICSLLSHEDRILRDAGCSFLEALVLRTYIRPKGEEELKNLAMVLRIPLTRFQGILSRFEKSE